MKSAALLLKLFILTAVLELGAFGEELNKDLRNTGSSFHLTKKANKNKTFLADSAKIKFEPRSMGLYPFSPNTKKPKSKNRPKRAAMSNRSRIWLGEDGRPEIPYVIEKNNFADYTKQTIHRAMRHWKKHVPCLRFVERTNQQSYLSFFAGKGCFSDVGRMGGRQRVSIGHGCQLLATIIHEIGHALGFWHEQSRPDRDRYVRIYWRNIRSNYRYAFNKHVDGRINSLGVPYDYDSIMHYDSTAFGDGRTTITRINGGKIVGNKRGLSPYDIKQAKLLYCRSERTPSTKAHVRAKRLRTGCLHRDSSLYCKYWARRGHCLSTGSRYSMMVNSCKKTCFCSKRWVLCRDKKPSCRYWSGKGYCRSHDSYMRRNCKKSCGMCTSSNTRNQNLHLV